MQETEKINFLKFISIPDIQFAIALFGLIFMILIPLHPLILDSLLVFSISFSFLVLLISVYIEKPIQFSTFPTLLLFATLYRLALNIATTRSILLEGHKGSVSVLVKSFGEFVVGGNYFVGIVIFTILVIINFIVITKGAGRVAEVGARFTLDAMPGKQMSIDAELNAGIIDKDEAKKRRNKIEDEADFYGAMDGASKFIRGDAIAGIMINIINIIMGLILGVVEYNMSFQKAAQTFTLLTIGDGLVSQIPALIISTAAGVMVTRTGSKLGFSLELKKQIIVHPKAMFISSFFMMILAVIPALPFLPFTILGLILFFAGRYGNKFLEKDKKSEIKEKDDEDLKIKDMENLLHVDLLSIEIGIGLIPLADANQDGEILDRIIAIRKQYVEEMGIILPMVIIKDNVNLKSNEYQILLKGEPIAKGKIMINHLLAMDPGDVQNKIKGIQTKEPAYNLDAIWIDKSQEDMAKISGYTVVNGPTIIVTHLSKIINEYFGELITWQEIENLTKRVQKSLFDKVIGQDKLDIGDILIIIKNLLKESVSVKDINTIFETLANNIKNTKDLDILTKYIRENLSRSIIKKYIDEDGLLTVINVDKIVEDTLHSLIKQKEDKTDLDPNIIDKIVNSVVINLKKFDKIPNTPIILCSSDIRFDFKNILDRFIPNITVLGFGEIPKNTKIKNIGMIKF